MMKMVNEMVRFSFYFFFFKFSFTLNFTILEIKSSGIGSSIGNCTDPLPCLYLDNSSENAACPVGVA